MTRLIVIGFSSGNMKEGQLFLKKQVAKYIEGYLESCSDIVYFFEEEDVDYNHALSSKVSKIKIGSMLRNSFNLVRSCSKDTKIIAAYPAAQRFPILLLLPRFTFYLGNDIFSNRKVSLFEKLKSFYHKLLVRRSSGVIVRGEWLKKNVLNLNSNVITSPPISIIAGDECIQTNATNYNLYVGNISKSKNTDKLIEYFHKRPSHELVLCGNFSLSNDYLDIVNNSENIQYLGYVYPEQMADLYTKAERLWMISDSEGLPRVIDEALNFGIPVWSTKLPTIIEEYGDKINYVQWPLDSRSLDLVISAKKEKTFNQRLLDVHEVSALHYKFS